MEGGEIDCRAFAVYDEFREGFAGRWREEDAPTAVAGSDEGAVSTGHWADEREAVGR